jgi:lysophospholipase L1-like esterase
MKTILFQGDSITDAGRDRNAESNSNMGLGYPSLVKAHLGYENPAKYVFINKGVSGDRAASIYARVYRDVLDLKPDYMSVLVGINDVWHNLDRVLTGQAITRFENAYNALIEEIKADSPETKIMLLEPFVLEGKSTTATEESPNRFEIFQKGAKAVSDATKRVAQKHGLLFVPLQEKFNELAEKMPAKDILIDGVHPTPVGHELIKRAWLEGFEKIK